MAGDSFLTGGDLRGEYKNSISVDQVAAQKLSKYTRFRSLTLSTDGGVTISLELQPYPLILQGKPIPSEHRQREIFERYFSLTEVTPLRKKKKSESE